MPHLSNIMLCQLFIHFVVYNLSTIYVHTCTCSYCCSGLDLVQKLSTTCTGHAQIETARLALHKLLSSNLAAKYWVTGRLDHTDLITDTEFFDAGPVSCSKHLYSVPSWYSSK